MTKDELKTLKDLKFFSGDNIEDILKAEAVKWVKKLDEENQDPKYNRCEEIEVGGLKDIKIDWEESSEIYGMIKILKYFFNLTEEDLI